MHCVCLLALWFSFLASRRVAVEPRVARRKTPLGATTRSGAPCRAGAPRRARTSPSHSAARMHLHTCCTSRHTVSETGLCAGRHKRAVAWPQHVMSGRQFPYAKRYGPAAGELSCVLRWVLWPQGRRCRCLGQQPLALALFLVAARRRGELPRLPPFLSLRHPFPSSPASLELSRDQRCSLRHFWRRHLCLLSLAQPLFSSPLPWRRRATPTRVVLFVVEHLGWRWRRPPSRLARAPCQWTPDVVAPATPCAYPHGLSRYCSTAPISIAGMVCRQRTDGTSAFGV